MRTIKWTSENDEEIMNTSSAGVDWKEGPEDVLEAVDRLLALRGLEVVIYDAGDDTVVFSIDDLKPQ